MTFYIGISTPTSPDLSIEASPGSKQTDVVMESITNPSTPASVMQVEPPDDSGGLTKAESTTMLCEPISPENGKVDEEEDSDAMTVNDLQLLCDLFYLPSEHGPKVSSHQPTL